VFPGPDKGLQAVHNKGSLWCAAGARDLQSVVLGCWIVSRLVSGMCVVIIMQ
jgi:hypothetical protein